MWTSALAGLGVFGAAAVAYRVRPSLFIRRRPPQPRAGYANFEAGYPLGEPLLRQAFVACVGCGGGYSSALDPGCNCPAGGVA